MELESEVDFRFLDDLGDFDAEALLADDPLLAEIAEDIASNSDTINFLPNHSEALNATTESKSAVVKKPLKSFTCKVCSFQAKGIRYLGGHVCLSCRTFFVRSTKEQAYKEFVCRRGEEGSAVKCKIDSKSRKSCRQCRFLRCLRAGMTIPGEPSGTDLVVVSGKSEDRGLMVDKLKRQIALAAKIRLYQCMTSSKRLTMEDMRVIEEFPIPYMNFGMMLLSKLAKHDIAHFQAMFESLYQDKEYPIYLHKTVYDYEKYMLKEFYFQQQSFPWDGIAQADRIRLIHQNGPLLLEFMTANRVGKDHHLEEDVDNFVNLTINDPDEAFGTKITTIVNNVIYEYYTTVPVHIITQMLLMPLLLLLLLHASVVFVAVAFVIAAAVVVATAVVAAVAVAVVIVIFAVVVVAAAVLLLLPCSSLTWYRLSLIIMGSYLALIIRTVSHVLCFRYPTTEHAANSLARTARSTAPCYGA